MKAASRVVTRTKLPKIVHEFTIDESKWVHGTKDADAENSALLVDAKGAPEHCKMCCLGFFAQSCGVKIKDLKGVGDPSSVNPDARTKKFSTILFETQGDDVTLGAQKMVVSSLIDINDAEGYTLASRKKRIKDLFRSEGVGVTFVKGA